MCKYKAYNASIGLILQPIKPIVLNLRKEDKEMPEVKYGLEIGYGTTYGLEEARALMECLENNAPSCGKKTVEFEKKFAEYCGVKYAISCTSATTGLTLTGIACGIKPGDEIITTPLSWIATASAFATLGARIVFCDVDERTLCMDPNKLEGLITAKTKAIVPVHLYGQFADIDKINEIAKKYNIVVIDDCAHNPGGSYKGRIAGSACDMSVFSFHQQKNMSTLGEGGMVTTSNKEFYEKVLSYRSLCCRTYGKSDKYLSVDESVHPMGKKYWQLFFDDVGYNFRMTDAQACVGIEQLKKLDSSNARRKELADLLSEKLKGIPGILLPLDRNYGKHTWHIYMIQLEKGVSFTKEDFMYELYYNKGVKAWSHYLPIHLSKPFMELGHKEGECPVYEEAFNRFVTLPIYPKLTEEAICYMAESIRQVVVELTVK